MQSIRELFKIGNGPSSSHTMGPKRAAQWFKDKNKEADKFDVYLYGSLAWTGEGHLTNKIIEEVLKPIETNIIFDMDFECTVHPNTMDLVAFKEGKEIDRQRIYSVGGGTIEIEGQPKESVPNIYTLKTFDEIKEYCVKKDISLADFVFEVEDENFKEHLKDVWKTMRECVLEGLSSDGNIPGKLQIPRKAKTIFETKEYDEDSTLRRTRLITSYAYAVSETNASGGVIVTAPTCGASGVLPAVLNYVYETRNIKEEQIINALAVAGLIGNIVKTNASISGAECGCQAEVGTACSMAAAAAAYLMGLDISQIENAAEIAMEHHLGLTCDPIYGYVQIPCIERNAVGAIRAIDAANMAKVINGKSYISFDLVVETMYETGKDLRSHYRETSEGGLAKKYCRNKYIVDKKDIQ